MREWRRSHKVNVLGFVATSRTNLRCQIRSCDKAALLSANGTIQATIGIQVLPKQIMLLSIFYILPRTGIRI